MKESINECTTMVDVLKYYSRTKSDEKAYIFLKDGEVEKEVVTFSELDEKAKTISEYLLSNNLTGERALLLYNSSINFIAAFFGCLYAGVIAVPAFPPRKNQKISRIENIINDCNPKVILSTEDIEEILSTNEESVSILNNIEWINTNNLNSSLKLDEKSLPIILPETIAFLQYTSGSSGNPKGVVITHKNLIHNQKLIKKGFEHSSSTVFVSWLPMFHDMGLIGNTLQPLYLGVLAVLMSPESFLQKPSRWLKAISKYKGTTSGAPNFAYDLCTEKIKRDDLGDLDLTSLDLAYNGAEPISVETIKKFYSKFKECGLSEIAMFPCYGLAEATLFVTGGPKKRKSTIKKVNKSLLEKGFIQEEEHLRNSKEIISCGTILEGVDLIIVDPETNEIQADDIVGEIWIQSDSVANGYWNKIEESEKTFNGSPLERKGTYLRTGDYGFIDNNELYVTGRLKDLIIVRGRNHYPQDIELSAARSHSDLQENASAAFTVQDDTHNERLVIIQELKRTSLRSFNSKEIFTAIREAVFIEHGLRVDAIILIRPYSILKTSSGKIQRKACKQKYILQELEVISEWNIQNFENHKNDLKENQNRILKNNQDKLVEVNINNFLKKSISSICNYPLDKIDENLDFNSFGIDSINAVSIIDNINEKFSINLDSTVFYNYPSINHLSNYLKKYFNENIKESEVIEDTSDSNKDSLETDIAIIGMGARFPGKSENIYKFWDFLLSDEDGIVDIRNDRWKMYSSLIPKELSYISKGGFIDNFDSFDNKFFNISPVEAEYMDPQQRILLEVCWHAFEDAGIKPSSLAKSNMGFFIGASSNDYARLNTDKNLKNTSPYFTTGNSSSIISNRLSYYFDTTGPSLTLDTACSSSLVVLHYACQSLKSNECEMAVVGGVNLILSPDTSLAFSKAQMLSEDAKCKSFDSLADGYVRGEGVGIIIIKRRSDAIRDNDNIIAVIKGSAVNQDGKTNGLTAPNGISQENVITQALLNSKISSESIDFIESHGTGTSLGDPIELNAINKIYNSSNRTNKLYVGALKTKIGHLESAAGIASIIKTALMLHNKKITPNLNFKQLNNLISSKNNLFFPKETLNWESNKLRRAGVSAFGFGGTNAHVILEEEKEFKGIDTKLNYNSDNIIVLSAKSLKSLKIYVAELLNIVKTTISPIKNNEELKSLISNISSDLQRRKDVMNVRFACVVKDVKDLIHSLDSFLNDVDEGNDYYFNDVSTQKNTINKIFENEDAHYFVMQLFKNNKLHEIAQMWVNGITIDWNNIYKTGIKSNISLPFYCFERNRIGRYDFSSIFQEKNSEITIYKKKWKESAKLTGQNVFLESDVFLILCKKEKLELFHNIFKNISAKVYFIPEQLFSNLKTDNEEFLSLLKDFDNNTYFNDLDFSEVKNIIYFDTIDYKDSNNDSFEERITLLQMLIKGYNFLKLAIFHLSSRNDNFLMSGTKMSGIIKVLGAEYNHVYSQTIDVSGENNILEILSVEYQNSLDNIYDGYFPEVIYKSDIRYLPELERIYINNEAEDFLKNSTIVITGGLSGIGAEIARFLSTKGIKKLVLTGVTPLPEKKYWKDNLRDLDLDNSIKEKIKLIVDLEKSGISVDIYIGKLTNRNLLEEFFSNIKQEVGQINGVIHCAGRVNENTPAFISKTLKEVGDVLEPKISGLEVLNDVLQKEKLDFFVLFSSISSLFPSLGVGVSDYALANDFMNYYSISNNKKDNFSLIKSVIWPSWSNLGMGKKINTKYFDMGLEAISFEEGLNVLLNIISGSTEHEIVPLKIRSEYESKVQSLLRVKKNIHNNQKIALHKSKEKQTTLVTESDYEFFLKKILSQELHIPTSDLDSEINFNEFGIDSIILVDIIKKIEKDLMIDFDPTSFWKYPTIKKLGEYINGLMHEKNEVEKDFFSTNRLSQNKIVEDKHSSKVAIIGVACNFPGAKNKEIFWENLKNGLSNIKEVPGDRWKINDYFSDTIAIGKSTSKWGGFIDGIEYFDESYFNISRDSAPHLDPLVRQFLETTTNAIYDAGYSKENIWNTNVGVFVGARSSNFSNYISDANKHTITGIGQNFIAAHVSHFFNLKGPSMVIDTACSSSIVSINSACQSILANESSIAIAGGVEILLDEKPYLILSQSHALSPDGKCHTFDKKANGFVPGEGSGVIILKSLEDAVKDGDYIYAVIDSIGVNNDGNTMGITTPNIDAQYEVINNTIHKAKIDPASISYIETHGTGTMIGDPIELNALRKVFDEYTGGAKQVCGIGSVKTNIGHLLSASGIAGVIKVILSIQNKQLPPTLNCETPNPRFKFEDSPFYIIDKLKDWTVSSDIRRAGISSFGFGGTNAHIIISEFKGNEQNHKKDKVNFPIFNRKRWWPVHEVTKKAIFSIDLLEDLSTRNDEYVFKTLINIENPILRDHRVHGIKIMPGVTFIDLIYQSLKLINYDTNDIILSDIIFKKPVSINDNTIELRITLNRADFGWSVIGKTKVTDSEEWNENFNCYIKNRQHKIVQKYDIQKLKDGAGKEFDLEDVYKITNSANISHYNFMKPRGKVYQNENYFLAELELGDLAGQFTNDFYFHPVFLDSSTIISCLFQIYNAKENSIKPYIPIYIDNLTISSYSKKRCYVYVEKQNNGISTDSLIFSDIIILDTDGNIIAFLERFNAKQIREKELITNLISNEDKVYNGNSFKAGDENILSDTWEAEINNLDSKSKEEFFIRKIKALVIDKENIIHEINNDDTFFDLGLDSISLLKLAELLERKINIKIYPTLFFQYNTISSIAKYLSQESKDQQKLSNTLENKDVSESMYLAPFWKKSNKIDELNQDDLNVDTIILNIEKSKNNLAEISNFNEIMISHSFTGFKRKNNEYCFNIYKEDNYKKMLKQLKCTTDEILIIINSDVKQLFNGVNISSNIFLRKVKPVFYFLKSLINIYSDKKISLMFISMFDEKKMLHSNIIESSIPSFLKSIGYEHNQFNHKSIFFHKSMKNDVRSIVKFEACNFLPKETEIQYINNERFIKCYTELKQKNEKDLSVIKENSVILITGGLGGLGYLVAKDMLEIPGITLLLVGKSMLTKDKEDKLKKLRLNGNKVKYFQVDIEDGSKVKAVIKNINKSFGNINVIIHAAGIIKDSLIREKEYKDFLEVCAPKINGILNIDYFTRYNAVDYFILFSSFSSILGNFGQSDYAFANSFLNNFSQFRNSMHDSKKRHGVTLSINWPLWEDGGMIVDKSTREVLCKTLGMMPLPTSLGLDMLNNTLKYREPIVAPLFADRSKLQTFLDIDKYEKTSFIDDYINKNISKTMKIKKMSIKTSFNAELEAIIVGEGVPIIFIPPFGMGMTVWSKIIESKIFSDYMMIFFHKPGHGNSEIISELRLEILTEHFYEAIKKIIGTTKAHLVGASLGGMVAQSLIQEFPDQFLTLSLSNSFSMISDNFIKLDRDKAFYFFKDLIKNEMNSIREDVENSQLFVDEEMILENSQNIKTKSIFSYVDNMKTFSTREKLHDISKPVFFITGGKDSLKKVIIDESDNECFSKRIKDFSYCEIEAAGHFPYITHFDHFSDKFFNFISKNNNKL
ncbi:MAG: hypothetical protein A2015_05060 [Spirochaetes bacterium GWF1_31_7]|nr:MAG: hypothetical protein A2Y30_06460 [Spirochaetes bacterium GWE1_32_154]OHD47213.1 MAG: hypothetical protein A2015_05060 [Spirochaetes bacterium GWF1_31_7]OHD52642.1 MAG: hypothetical protein A2Y29_09705 [Spirochaetes bacterium GWE2_31_10]HBI36193.1 hypothetical protein [Spirochaetia bacterium]